MNFYPFPCNFISRGSKYSPSYLAINTTNQICSLGIRFRVQYAYKTIGKTVLLNTLNLQKFDRRKEDYTFYIILYKLIRIRLCKTNERAFDR